VVDRPGGGRPLAVRAEGHDDGVHARDGVGQGHGTRHVPDHEGRRGRERGASRVADEGPDAVAGGEGFGDDVASDAACGADDENGEGHGTSRHPRPRAGKAAV
jgi:hypothetical protein